MHSPNLYIKGVVDKQKLQHNTFGNQSRIISDKGPAITPNDFQTYCQENKIQHIKITAAIPR